MYYKEKYCYTEDLFVIAVGVVMQKLKLKGLEKNLVGIAVRTNNKMEMDHQTAKIGPLVQKYWEEGIFNKISKRKSPGVTYCAYTNYENDFNGDYTFFIGEEVIDFSDLKDSLTPLIVPEQTYVRFTNGPGPIPNVSVEIWQKVWQMTSNELGGDRSYAVDFEVYDERSHDLTAATLDLYIGVE